MTATPDPVSPGGQVNYQITVTNQSAEMVTGLDIRSVLPAHTDAKEDNTGGDCDGFDGEDSFACNAGETIKFDVGDLPAGESTVVSYTAQVRTGDQAPPDGSVLDGNATADSYQTGASASADVVVDSSPALFLTMGGAESPVSPGQEQTYTLTYSVPGDESLSGTSLQAEMPSGASFVSATGGGSISDGQVQWDLGTLQPGEGGHQTFTVEAGSELSEGALLTSETEVSSGSSVARSQAATAVSTEPPVSLAMTAGSDPVSPGGQVNYQITVTNQSAEMVTGLDIRSVLPAHTDAKEDNTGGDCDGFDGEDSFACNAGETIKFDVGDLPAGESTVVSYTAQVRTGDQAPPDGSVLNGNATADSYQTGASASADVVYGTLADNGTPSVPNGLMATGGDGKVSLSWDANAESDLAGYNVYRSPSFFSDPIDETKLNTSPLSDSSYTDTGVTSDSTYYYQVTAVDDAGNESGPSNQVSATVSSGPFADWPDLEDPSITFKVVSPGVNVSKVQLKLEGRNGVSTASLSEGFAKFPNPDPVFSGADEFTQIRLINESDQVLGYLPFKYEISDFGGEVGIDAVIYVHDENDLRPDLTSNRWSDKWEYYDVPDVSDPYPLSMLVPPKGEIDSVDLNQQDPVVLVHGVSGSYPSWGGEISKVRELVGHLSSKGYDGWQFYYPENQNITKSGPLLAKAIHRLQNNLGYGPAQSFDLVAHSMGGLVSRHYIQRMGIGPGRSTYSQILNFEPGGPGENVDKLLMLGTPNHGSYAAFRCTEEGSVTCGNYPPAYKDKGAPAFRQMTPGGNFLKDLNRSEGASSPYTRNSTLVLGGTRNPPFNAGVLESTVTEIPDQDDGFVAVSSASLLDLDIPLAVGDFTHTGAIDIDPQYDPRLNEDTEDLVTFFLSDQYDVVNSSNPPDSDEGVTGFWNVSSSGNPILVDPPPEGLNTEEGILTFDLSEGMNVDELSIAGCIGYEACLRVGSGKESLEKVPKQNGFFTKSTFREIKTSIYSLIYPFPTFYPDEYATMGFRAITGIGEGTRTLPVQKRFCGGEWGPTGKVSVTTKYMQTTQARLNFDDVTISNVNSYGCIPTSGIVSTSPTSSENISANTLSAKARTAEPQFQVDAATDTLTFWMAQDSTGDFSGHNMRLETPDGAVIDSSEAKSESGMGYTQNHDLGYAIYLVANPEPGQWTVLHDASVPATVSAPVVSTVDLRVSAPDSSFTTGETVPVTVSFSGQNTYEDMDVSAQLRVEDPEGGGMTTLGSIDLSESGPTTYEGTFSPSYVGPHTVTIDFSAKVGGKSVLRRTAESVTVLGDSTNIAPEPPSAPTNLSAQLEGREGVALSWSEGDSGGVEGYRIYRDTIPNPAQQVASVPSGQTSYADSEVRGGQVYYYRVAAVGTGGVESDPTDGASVFTYPSSLSVNIQRSFGSASSEQGYRLIALPGAAAQPLQETLSGQSGSEWQAWWDDGSSDNYFQKFDGSDTFRFQAGRGFWALGKSNWSVNRSVETVPLGDKEQTLIPLHDGWNIISNPFGGDVSWAQVNAAHSDSLRALWQFNGTFAQADTFRSARAGEAFYFLNDTGLDSLSVPYPGAPSVKKQAKEDPLLTIQARPENQDAPTSTVKVGFDEDADEGLGRLDEPAPPGQFSALNLRLRVPGEVPERQRLLMTEQRPLDSGAEEGQTFQLRLRAEMDMPIEVTASGLEAIGSSEAKLLQPSAGRSYDLGGEGEPVIFEVADSTTALKLAVGSASYVENQAEEVAPDEVSLTSYPNPVRKQATVEYTLTEPTDVRITVYDVLGRQVATLEKGRRQAGRHTLTLDGSRLPSGVYFGRLQAGDETRTQKITVVR